MFAFSYYLSISATLKKYILLKYVLSISERLVLLHYIVNVLVSATFFKAPTTFATSRLKVSLENKAKNSS